MYKTFEEMPVWQKGMELSIKVFEISSTLPRSEDYGLTSQLRRAANSVSANIAEGFGRNSNKDKCQFYIIARSSAYEIQSHLTYGVRVMYFNMDKVNDLKNSYSGLIFELNKIIKSLRS
jgi:four helix bundle protein